MKEKSWNIKAGDGTVFKFTPVYTVHNEGSNDPASKDVEATGIVIEVGDKTYNFNYMNIYQFMYFTASEEFRRGLALRSERREFRLPYEVSFKLDEKEKKEGMAKRRIELPVDEITMAICRNEAHKLMPGVLSHVSKGGKPWELYKGRAR